jgi:hypothetical protein
MEVAAASPLASARLASAQTVAANQTWKKPDPLVLFAIGSLLCS